jgi:hypothetical protein
VAFSRGEYFLERAVYDQNSGQLVTASLMDYAVPRANEVPAIAFETCDVRCRHNPLGMKGAGEAGAIGSCPAVMNAIIDALACLPYFPSRHAGNAGARVECNPRYRPGAGSVARQASWRRKVAVTQDRMG